MDANQHSELHAEAQRLLEDGPRGDVWTEAWIETAKDVIASLIEQSETLDEALREILDVTEKWTRRMTDEERLLHIDTIAKAALPKVSKTKR